MARDVFRLVWMNRKEAVLLTYQMPEDCAAKDSETYTTALSSKEAQLEKLQKNNPNWVDWRCYLFYSTANQAYDWYIQAFTEEDETVCRKLREDLQNDSALKNRLHLSEN